MTTFGGHTVPFVFGGGGGGGISIGFSEIIEFGSGGFSLNIDFFDNGVIEVTRDSTVILTSFWASTAPDPLIFGLYDIRDAIDLRSTWNFPSAPTGTWTNLGPVGGNPKRWSENITLGGINVRSLFEFRDVATMTLQGTGIVDFQP